MRACKQSAVLLSVCIRAVSAVRIGVVHSRTFGNQSNSPAYGCMPKLGCKVCGVTDGGVDTMSTLRQLVSADMEQCVHMQMWNSVCTCRSGIVCEHAVALACSVVLPCLTCMLCHFSATTNSPVYHTCWSVLLCGAPGHANGPPATAAAAQAAAIVSASRGPIMHDQCTTVSM